MISLNPIFADLIGFIAISSIIIAKVWFHKATIPKDQNIQRLYKGARAIGFSFLAFVGLLLWDYVVKIGFLGIISHGNLNYHLGSLIICAVFASILIVGVAFVAPTIKSLISFAIILVMFVNAYWINVDLIAPNEDAIIGLLLPYVAIPTVSIEIITILIQFALKRDVSEMKPLWDFSEKFKKIVNWKIIIPLWVLFTVELILKMEGLGILFWI